jgi:hypothetical protein
MLGGCLDEADLADESDSTFSITVSAADGTRTLELLNYPGTDLKRLDDDAGLDSRAATGIIAHRNGPDGKIFGGDDDLFEDLAEADQIPYVGDAALTRLVEYAKAHPAPAGEIAETVTFKGWEVEAVLWGVNHATVAELDIDAGLDARAAQNLVAGAPYASVSAMGGVAYVGTTALTALRSRASVWWMVRATAGGGGGGGTTGGGLAGTFDGIYFDEATAKTALSIANLAPRETMVDHGVYAPGAAAIVGNRPYATLAQVAAVAGVATSTMRGLRDYAASGTWVPPADHPCTLALATRADVAVSDFTELLAIATTGDWPFADMRALQIDPCNDLNNATTQAALAEMLRTSSLIDWGYTDNTHPGTASFNQAGSRYLAHMTSANDRISERVGDGVWTPANAEEQALLDRLPTLMSTLTSAPAARPADFVEVAMTLSAEECSQYASALVERATGRVWVIHRFPGC